MHYFNEGDIVSVPDECDLQKAEQLVELRRAEWVKGEPSMEWLKKDLRDYAREQGLSTSGTKKEILERINANS